MNNEEINALRSLFREEVNTSEQRLRGILREEIDAAVYASEARMTERVSVGFKRVDERLSQVDEHLNRVDERLSQVDEHLNRVDERLNRVEDRLGHLETGQQQIKVDLSQTISVLDEATRVINDLQKSQHALEEKFEDNILAIRRDMQKLTATIHTFAKEFIEMNRLTNERITLHERTPLDQAHPRPHSAA